MFGSLAVRWRYRPLKDPGAISGSCPAILRAHLWSAKINTVMGRGTQGLAMEIVGCFDTFVLLSWRIGRDDIHVSARPRADRVIMIVIFTFCCFSPSCRNLHPTWLSIVTGGRAWAAVACGLIKFLGYGILSLSLYIQMRLSSVAARCDAVFCDTSAACARCRRTGNSQTGRAGMGSARLAYT